METSERRRAAYGRAVQNVVVVANGGAEKAISKTTALSWCLTQVVRPGDGVVFLVVFPTEKNGIRRFLNIPKFTGDCGSGVFREEELPEQIGRISEYCSQMLLQLHDNQIQVKVSVKVVSGANAAAVVAEEAQGCGATWVILDKKLKQELKHCMDNLRCNIALMKGSKAKVVRLSLQSTKEPETTYSSAVSSMYLDHGKHQIQRKKKHSTPVSSPEEPRASCSTSTGDALLSSPDAMGSFMKMYHQNGLLKGLRGQKQSLVGNRHSSDEVLISAKSKLPNLSTNRAASLPTVERSMRHVTKSSTSRNNLLKDFNQLKDLEGIREVVSSGRTSSSPPPLCSICRNKAPNPGQPPRDFSYKELAVATDGFSNTSLVAEGDLGSVYKGVLSDGQVVAVKVLKFRGLQADADFCREVQLLSCAQHKNVLLLIGFSVDHEKRILVYEYICNGSLDLHLHGTNRSALDWGSRLKLAIGVARGLRYLHQDCRVGCIVHGRLRSSNILLTHDYEPLVTNFGLAEWESESSVGIRRVTETARVDVYAFGEVLLELLGGRRSGDLKWRNEKGEPAVLLGHHILANAHQLLDLNSPSRHQVKAMALVASMCLSSDPDNRPTMSKVLGILEGGITGNPGLQLVTTTTSNRNEDLYRLKKSERPVEKASKTHLRAHSH